jgi:hypothetical protein
MPFGELSEPPRRQDRQKKFLLDFSTAGALGALAVFLSRVLSEGHWF